MNIPSECRIARIDPNRAMILSHDPNPGRMEFPERTTGNPEPCRIRLLAREWDKPFEVMRARHENSPRPCAINSRERKPGNANAGNSGRQEKARAELTGAGGSHPSST